MATAYQFTASGYYAGPVEDYGLLPNNATYEAPPEKEGFIPRWNGESWDLEENHVGETGYLNGVYTVIKDYGPLPEGWSTSPPEPSDEEKYNAEREAIDKKYSAPWDGATGGIFSILQMTMTSTQFEKAPDETMIAELRDQYAAELAALDAELKALDEKYGV